MSDPNTNLNLNAARQDRFFLRFGDIPSAKLLTPVEASMAQKLKFSQDDKEFFHLALKSAQLPGVSLGEVKIDTMFVPFADSDMKFTFEPLVTSMRMDSNWILYKLLVLWVFMTKHPEQASQGGMAETFETTTIDAILMIKDNFGEDVMSVEFYGLRPLALPTIDLDYTNNGEEIVVPITWSYSYFLPKTIGGEDFPVSVVE